jgi:hypothetical protein
MTLLMIQFETGSLSIDDIKYVIGGRFDAIWNRICTKFKQDEDGRYYQWRIREEKVKRVKFTDSRKKNLSKPHMKPHMDNHMKDHMENENRNIDSSLITTIPILSHLDKFLQDTVSKENAYKFVKALGKPMSMEQIEKLAPAHDAQFSLSHNGGDYTKWCQYLCYFLRDNKSTQAKAGELLPDGKRKMTPR